MLNSWFGSKSSRRAQSRQTRPSSPPTSDHVPLGYSDVSSVSRSAVGPLQGSGNLTSVSDIPLDEVHAHINDPSLYAATPSLIHSTEKEAATLRTPDGPTASLDAVAHQPDCAQSPPAPEGTLFTPQDAIIAQIFGKSAPPATDSAHATPPPPSSAPRPSVSLTTSDSLPLPPSMQTSPPSGARPGPTLPTYDPFSGVKLGEHTSLSPSSTGPRELFSFAPVPAVDDHNLWSSLERILELQAEIAVMHADMEGVGARASGNGPAGAVSVGADEGGKAGPKERSRRSQTLLVGDEEPEEHEPEGGAGAVASEASVDHSDGEDEDEDNDDIHGYGRKRRDEEFARLAEQFAQRKGAIGGIMNKLDDLSMALKTFHALPPPLFDLVSSPSRTNTLSSAPSNVSATSSPPPLHPYSGQPSSPISSISPPQAVIATTPPALSLSLPVPPISALVSSVSPSGRPAVGFVVAPVLPRAAVPTIMPGIPRVESPSEMAPAHSVLGGMP